MFKSFIAIIAIAITIVQVNGAPSSKGGLFLREISTGRPERLQQAPVVFVPVAIQRGTEIIFLPGVFDGMDEQQALGLVLAVRSEASLRDRR